MLYHKQDTANGWNVLDENENLVFRVVAVPEYDTLGDNKLYMQYHVFNSFGEAVDVYQAAYGGEYDPLSDSFVQTQNNIYNFAQIRQNVFNSYNSAEINKINLIINMMKQTSLPYHIAATLWVDPAPKEEIFEDVIVTPPTETTPAEVNIVYTPAPVTEQPPVYIIPPGDPTTANPHEDEMSVLAPDDERVLQPIAPGDPSEWDQVDVVKDDEIIIDYGEPIDGGDNNPLNDPIYNPNIPHPGYHWVVTNSGIMGGVNIGYWEKDNQNGAPTLARWRQLGLNPDEKTTLKIAAAIIIGSILLLSRD